MHYITFPDGKICFCCNLKFCHKKIDSWTTITSTVPILYVRLFKLKNYDAQMVTTQVYMPI